MSLRKFGTGEVIQPTEEEATQIRAAAAKVVEQGSGVNERLAHEDDVDSEE